MLAIILQLIYWYWTTWNKGGISTQIIWMKSARWVHLCHSELLSKLCLDSSQKNKKQGSELKPSGLCFCLGFKNSKIWWVKIIHALPTCTEALLQPSPPITFQNSSWSLSKFIIINPVKRSQYWKQTNASKNLAQQFDASQSKTVKSPKIKGVMVNCTQGIWE